MKSPISDAGPEGVNRFREKSMVLKGVAERVLMIGISQVGSFAML